LFESTPNIEPVSEPMGTWLSLKPLDQEDIDIIFEKERLDINLQK